MAKNKKIKVGVIFGGRSGEHEVSLVSASSVIKNLDKSKYSVVPIGISKQGLFITKDPMKSLKSGKIKDKGYRLIAENILKECDVIFPVIHGPFGEDGTLQGMLEMANIAYVGSGVLGAAVGMDKIIQKQVCQAVGVPVVSYEWFLSKDWKNNKQKILKLIKNNLKYPVFVKPANMGSSVGISKAHNEKELVSAINLASKFDRRVIVEQGLEQVLEIEVAVLGNDDPQASVPGQVIASNEFYDYNAKYVDGKSETVIPARLSQKVKKEIEKIAIDSYKALDLAGLTRADFLVTKKGKIYLNEVNTIPGFTAISMYPKLWQASGVSYSKLLDKLINLAIERHRERNKLLTSYKPKNEWYK